MGTEEMNNEKQTISKEEAAATLKSVDSTCLLYTSPSPRD